MYYLVTFDDPQFQRTLARSKDFPVWGTGIVVCVHGNQWVYWIAEDKAYDLEPILGVSLTKLDIDTTAPSEWGKTEGSAKYTTLQYWESLDIF